MRKLNQLLQETRNTLKTNYFSDDRPWVIAYSGGKDSTLVLQLVYEFLLEIKEKAIKPIHIICSDTRVEAPNVAAYIHNTLNKLAEHAKAAHFPLFVHVVQPTPDESFWFNIIGKGYPTPTSSFRWCTTRMKIKPSRRAIEKIVKQHGSVIILIGVRSAESSNRAKIIKSRDYNSRGLHSHNDIPDALILSPIVDWDTDSVWQYLFTNNPAPWGSKHDFMLDLYRQASGGECPVYQFRNRLKNEIRTDENMRMDQRRNGSPVANGKGYFTLKECKIILSELLCLEQIIKVIFIYEFARSLYSFNYPSSSRCIRYKKIWW